MASDAEAQLMAMTGIALPEAKMYLEMAGGDVSTAVALLFDDPSGGGGGGGGGGHTPVTLDWAPDVYDLVWQRGPDGDQVPIPDSWLLQGLGTASEAASQLGFVQPKNGPCGVLAVVQAEYIHACILDGVWPEPGTPVERERLCRVLVHVLRRCAGGAGVVRLATWSGAVGQGIDVTDVAASTTSTTSTSGDSPPLLDAVRQRMDSFVAPGGPVLLVYSCVLTRGADVVQRDMMACGEGPPLIVGPFCLCTSELMGLLMIGRATGNVGAFHASGDKNTEWPHTGVGMLSMAEIDTGIPLNDALKRPESPVWIVHGGDHFTVLFATGPVSDEPGTVFTAHHWNGLPPGGPRWSRITVTHRGKASAAPKQAKATFFKDVPGEISDVIQGHDGDRAQFPKQWKRWRFEVALAVDDPDVEGAPRPPDAAAPVTFELGEAPTGAWRCASCYATRYKTMCFGLNDAGATTCRHCDKPQHEARWTLWMAYDALPGNIRARVDRRYGPKIVTIVRTAFPGADIQLEDEKSPPSV